MGDIAVNSETKEQLKLAYLETEKIEDAFALVRNRHNKYVFFTRYGHLRKSDPEFKRDMKEIHNLIKVRRKVRHLLRERKRRPDLTAEDKEKIKQRMLDEFEKSLTYTYRKVGINNAMYHGFRVDVNFARQMDKKIAENYEAKGLVRRAKRTWNVPPPLWQPPNL